MLTVTGSVAAQCTRRNRAGAGGGPVGEGSQVRGFSAADVRAMKKSGSGYELFADAQFRELWGANLILTLGMVMLQLGCG